MNTIKRIKAIIEHKKMSIRSFERLIGVSINVIQAALKKDSGVKDDTLAKIINACPDINLMWLITGEGSMILDKNTALSEHTFKTMEETKLQHAAHIEGLKTLLEAKDEIISLQKEKIQLLQEYNKAEKLEHIIAQNQRIMEYFEVQEIEKAIKEAKERIKEDMENTKEDR